MANRKRWAYACVFLSLSVLLGYPQLESAVASTASLDTESINLQNISASNNLKTEKINFNTSGSSMTLDGFIEQTLATNVNEQDKLANAAPYTLLQPKNLLVKDDWFSNQTTLADYSEKVKKLKKMQKLASYISETYKVPLDKAENIVYSTFVEANKKNLDPAMVLSVIKVESAFDPHCRSHMGAVGLTQIMPLVHRERIAELNREKMDILSIKGNIKVGTDILKDYVSLAGGNMKKALQMYNGNSRDKSYAYSNKIIKNMQTFNMIAMN